jgi:hypothetical protein
MAGAAPRANQQNAARIFIPSILSACIGGKEAMHAVRLMLESGSSTMQQISRFIAGHRNLRASCEPGDIVCAAWNRAVGKKIAVHTRASKMVRETLVVEVEDWLWQRNLMGLSRTILKNLEQVVGPGMVADLEFRVIPPRRGPQLAEASTQAFALTDESDGIVDPGLRRIYRRRRQKEIA